MQFTQTRLWQCCLISLTGVTLLAGCGGGNQTTTPAPVVSYTIQDIGLPPATTSASGLAISNAGQILLLASTNGSSVTKNAFLYQNGSFTNLVPASQFDPTANIVAMNNTGTVISNSYTHRYSYHNGAVTDLTQIPGYRLEGVVQLNDTNVIVGSVSTTVPLPTNPSAMTSHAAIYANGVTTDIGTLPGDNVSYGTTIDNSGDIAGDSWKIAIGVQAHPRAFLYHNGHMTDLGVLPQTTSSHASAINEKGQVAGTSGYHIFFYDGSKMQDCGTIGDATVTVNAMNASGQIVGTYSHLLTSSLQPSTQISAAANPELAVYRPKPFLYSDGKLQDLNSLIPPTPGLELTSADGITDAGQIVCTATMNYKTRVYLLTPK